MRRKRGEKRNRQKETAWHTIVYDDCGQDPVWNLFLKENHYPNSPVHSAEHVIRMIGNDGDYDTMGTEYRTCGGVGKTDGDG